MILVDTSVWIEIFRDKTGNIVKAFQKATGAENYAIMRKVIVHRHAAGYFKRLNSKPPGLCRILQADRLLPNFVDAF